MTPGVEILKAAKEVTVPDRAALLVLVYETSGAEIFSSAVSSPVALIVESLQEVWLARSQSRSTLDRVALVLVDDGSVAPALSESLFEALRGVCGSLTLELSPQGLNINLVRARAMDQALSVLGYLADESAGFVAGSTIDLF